MLTFSVDRIPLPQADEWHGWGSHLSVSPDERLVILSVPHGRSANRLCTVDLVNGRAIAEEALRGEVRDAVFDSPDGGWLLTTFALSRIQISGATARTGPQSRPRGLGTYLHRLFALGREHLGVSGWATKSFGVIERQSGALVKRIRVVAPHVALETEDGVQLVAPHGGECVDLDLPSMQVTRRRPMTTGTSPIVTADEIILLEGERSAAPMVPLEKLWRVKPQRLAVLDRESLTPIRSGTAPADARDVIGLDKADRLVVSTANGLALADRRDLSEIGRVDIPGLRQPIHSHRWLPDREAVVALPERFTTNELVTLTWSG